MPVQRVETPRLVLRQWSDADREPFAAMNADPQVVEHLPALLGRRDSDAMVDRLARDLETQGWGLWAVENLATGELVGFTGLAVPRFEAAFTPCVEIGWRLARGAWGHGFATEAAKAALHVGFVRMRLDEVVSFTAATNVRSQAVMRRIGMTHDPAEDFDHPNLPPGHRLSRHVLFRTRQLTG
jgi:RimJ/RimL family protein N-acetyltransferase